jgi:hypothetical protein
MAVAVLTGACVAATAGIPALGGTVVDPGSGRVSLAGKSDLAVGSTAPEIKGKDANGKPLKLSDFRGKVVVLDFWGDW